MDAGELKLTAASNLINLRKKAGMTQAELGARINYSDKTVSKWERAEAVPDAYVLKQLSEIYGVTVDYLLSSHDGWEYPADPGKPGETMYSAGVLIALVIVGIMTAALTAFVVCWMLGIVEWRIFMLGAWAASVAYLVLDCVLEKAKHLRPALAAVIVCSFGLIYFIFVQNNIWQIFIILVPALAIAFLSTKLPKKTAKLRKNRKNQQ